jgi:hypothetical protein
VSSLGVAPLLSFGVDPDACPSGGLLASQRVELGAKNAIATLAERIVPLSQPCSSYLAPGQHPRIRVFSDAATTMANADATGRSTRDKIVYANPFLERFTVADLKSWAQRKMDMQLANQICSRVEQSGPAGGRTRKS